MKLITLFLTFILSAQLVYANATVCSNFGKCPSAFSKSKEVMSHCEAASKSENGTKNKSVKTPCKCCAVLTFETPLNPSAALESTLSFIEFSYTERSFLTSTSVLLRPPIS